MTEDVRRRTARAALVLVLVTSAWVAPPAAAQAAPVTISADPATGLRDGQDVTVTVTGSLEDDLTIRQCASGATSARRCASPHGVYPGYAPTGPRVATVVVDSAIGLLEGTTVDCRAAGACVLVAGDPAAPDRSAVVPLAFDPAAPLVAPPTVSVSPVSGIVDHDEVTLSGVGFRADEYVQIIQCRAGGAFPGDCDRSAQDWAFGEVGADGTFAQQVVVDASFASFAGGVVDCRSDATCTLLAFNAAESASVALGFDPTADLRPPVMRVVPATDLVDGQLVDVEVDGSRGPLRQCTAGSADTGDCGRPRYGDGAEGGGPSSIRTRLAVDASFRTADGTSVDCRVTTCALVAGDLGDPGDAATVDLGFDPLAPLRPPPVVTADPDSGLLDGQVVTVRAAGFTPGAGVEVSQCPPPTSREAGCDGSGSYGTFELVGEDGSLQASLAVDAILRGVGEGSVDCRSSVEPCRLVVRSFEDDALAATPLGFDPAGRLLPPPSLTADPVSDLQDGLVVTARGVGFRPGDAAVYQCPAAVAAASGCDGRFGNQIGFARAEADGVLAASVEVQAVVAGADGDVDCASAPGTCVLVADSVRGGAPSNSVPLAFGPPTQPRGRYLDEVFEDVTVTTDVVYRRTTDPEGRPLDLRIDIYSPAGDTVRSRPAMLWMHGGYFTSGDKRNMASFAEAMARRGYVSASVQYRLASDPNIGVRAQHAYEDVRAAVGWLAEHAEEYGVDPRAIAVGGYSAGAVTALNLAYGPDLAAGDTAGVAAAVSLAGVQTTGAVEPGEGPSLFFHAPDDGVVPYSAGRSVCDLVLAAGIVCDFVTYEGVGHGLTRFQSDITRRTADFLAVNVLEPLGFFGPVARPGGPYSVVEGSVVTLDGTRSSGDGLRFAWSPSGQLSDPTDPRPQWTGVDDGAEVFELVVRDAAGATSRVETHVVVENAPPAIDTFTVAPARGGRHKKVRLSYTDPGVADTHVAVIDWGDGTAAEEVRPRSGGPARVRADHKYARPGTYTVTASVVDDDGGATTSTATATVRGPGAGRPSSPPRGRLR